MTPLQHRQKMDRWAYYGKLGSLRMAEQTLHNINLAYGRNDPALNLQITSVIQAVQKIRELLIAHKDDWRNHQPSAQTITLDFP